MNLFAESIGAGEPVLILLHGMGANGAVFKPLLRALAWPGRILVPDLRGHGRSPHGKHYSLGAHAVDIAELLEPGASVHVVGHSMGGAVGLILASGFFGVTVSRLTAFGVKVTWLPEELEKGSTFAATPVRWFETRAAAAERFIRVAGLSPYVTASEPVVAAGIAEQHGRYRLAADNATVRVVGPAVADMVAAARAPVRLCCGANDPMVSLAELRALEPQALAIDGCGHNPHVEAPEKLAAIVRELHLAQG
jgi:pimeloyl-ACP methyl ester carboxylesterase